jgi:hypothetical protein
MFNVYKKKYLKTASKKEHVTKELSYSVVSATLADIPLVDCITPATIHVILGLTKKIVEWILILWSRIETLKEEKTTGHTMYHCCQVVVEACDYAIEYVAHLKKELEGITNAVRGRPRAERRR